MGAARLRADRGCGAHGHLHGGRQCSVVAAELAVDGHRRGLRTEREWKLHADDLSRLRSGVPAAALLGGGRAGNGRVLLCADTSPCDLRGEPGDGSSGRDNDDHRHGCNQCARCGAALAGRATDGLARGAAASGAAWVGTTPRTSAGHGCHAMLCVAGRRMRRFAVNSAGERFVAHQSGHSNTERDL